MKCATCSSDNRHDANFCTACGSELRGTNARKLDTSHQVRLSGADPEEERIRNLRDARGEKALGNGLLILAAILIALGVVALFIKSWGIARYAGLIAGAVALVSGVAFQLSAAYRRIKYEN